MNELNIIGLFYVAFRLAPFILVCFFTLGSIINQDVKGFIYLVGLLLSCFIALLIGNSSNIFMKNDDPADPLFNNITRVCNVLTIGKGGPVSNLPLNMVVFSYTYFYLLYTIIINGIAIQNIPTLILFPILIITDFLWNITNKCAKPVSYISACLVGLTIGSGWAGLLYSLKLNKLLYFSGISNKETCSRPSKQSFKCVEKWRKNV